MEFVGTCVKGGAEAGVVVPDCFVEEVAGLFVEGVGFECFVREGFLYVVFVWVVAEDGCDGELAICFGDLFLKFGVVFDCEGDGSCGEDGVEACGEFALVGVGFVSFCFLVEVFEGVADDFADAFGGGEGPFGVDCGDLFVWGVVFLFDGVDVVDAEGEDVSVVDCVDDGVGVESVAEGLFCGFEYG